MKELSKEIIEIDGKEYTLFLNRKGLTAWEAYCNKFLDEAKKVKEHVDNLNKKFDKIEDDCNPFDTIEDIDKIENDSKVVTSMYKRLYWIMLYTEHKFSYSIAEEIYNKGCQEYGEAQIIDLGVQMIEEININKYEKNNQNLKNLKALKPKK